MSGIETIGLLASCAQLAEYAGQAAKYIKKFVEGGTQYNEMTGQRKTEVHELESKLRALQTTLRLFGDVAQRLEASGIERQQDEMNAIFVLRENVVNSGKTLQGLFTSWEVLKRHESRKTLARAVEFWCYDQRGKKDVDRGLKEIGDRVESMNSALSCINTYQLNEIRRLPPPPPSFTKTASIASSDDSRTLLDPDEDGWALGPIIDKEFFTDTGLSYTLIFAIEKKEHAAIRSLLDGGDDPLAEDANGWCALHYAVRADSERVMRELLAFEKIKNSKGAIDQTDKNGATALHFAASIGRKTMAYELLEATADKDAPDLHGRSPLIIAVEGNHLSVVELLLDRGAKVPKKRPKRLKEMQDAINFRRRIAARAGSNQK